MHKIGGSVYKFKNYQNAPLELLEGEIKQILNGGKFYVILWWGKGGEWTDTERSEVVYLSIQNAAIAYFTKLTEGHTAEIKDFKQVWQDATEQDKVEFQKFFEDVHV